MRKIITILSTLLLMFVAVSAIIDGTDDNSCSTPTTSATLKVIAPELLGQYFTVTINSTQICNFRGLEFTFDHDNKVADVLLDSPLLIGDLNSEGTIAMDENNKVVVYSPEPVNISGGIISFRFKSLGEPNNPLSIDLTSQVISIGTATPITPSVSKLIGAKISECIDYPNSHPSETGQVIPGIELSCACDVGSNLEVNPSTGEYECSPTSASDLFGDNAVSCSDEGAGDPIFDTGFCCIEGYQINHTLNNYEDIFGNPTTTCEEIPNVPPTANIYQPPETLIVGEPINFSSLGSQDTDGDIVEYIWDFGDDSTPSNQISSVHTYTSVSACPDGACQVKLTVVDDDGAEGIDSKTITLTGFTDAEIPESICGNDILEEGEVCDGGDDYVCSEDETCRLDCSGCLSASIPGIAIGQTYTDTELSQLGLSRGTSNPLPDGRIVIISAAGTITDIQQPSTLVSICGNAICESDETSALCMQDCHAGDNVCQKSLGETPSNSQGDCKKSRFGLILGIFISLGGIGGGVFLVRKKLIGRIGPFSHKDIGGPSGGSSFDLHRMAEKHGVASPGADPNKLVDYIQETKGQGYSFSQTKNALLKKGWKESQIDAAFAKV